MRNTGDFAPLWRKCVLYVLPFVAIFVLSCAASRTSDAVDEVVRLREKCEEMQQAIAKVEAGANPQGLRLPADPDEAGDPRQTVRFFQRSGRERGRQEAQAIPHIEEYRRQAIRGH
jgi:hypothetical protein